MERKFDFHVILRLEVQLKNVRRLPLFLVILSSPVLPVNKVISINIMLKFRWRWSSLVMNSFVFPLISITIKGGLWKTCWSHGWVHSKTLFKILIANKQYFCNFFSQCCFWHCNHHVHHIPLAMTGIATICHLLIFYIREWKIQMKR